MIDYPIASTGYTMRTRAICGELHSSSKSSEETFIQNNSSYAFSRTTMSSSTTNSTQPIPNIVTDMQMAELVFSSTSKARKMPTNKNNKNKKLKLSIQNDFQQDQQPTQHGIFSEYRVTHCLIVDSDVDTDTDTNGDRDDDRPLSSLLLTGQRKRKSDNKEGKNLGVIKSKAEKDNKDTKKDAKSIKNRITKTKKVRENKASASASRSPSRSSASHSPRLTGDGDRAAGTHGIDGKEATAVQKAIEVLKHHAAVRAGVGRRDPNLTCFWKLLRSNDNLITLKHADQWEVGQLLDWRFEGGEWRGRGTFVGLVVDEDGQTKCRLKLTLPTEEAGDEIIVDTFQLDVPQGRPKPRPAPSIPAGVMGDLFGILPAVASAFHDRPL